MKCRKKYDAVIYILYTLLIQLALSGAQKAEAQMLTSYDGTNAMSQVTQVNQLQDVEPTSWAYEALRSLVERYGCIVGNFNTYQGTRYLTRWEFAAGLNACLNVIERLSQNEVAIQKEDIGIIKRLAKEFAPELVVLGSKIDQLEQKTAFLEDNQFATTTKLRAEVIFVVSDTFGDKVGTNKDRSETTLGDRVRIALNTSFRGNDLLRVRLQANLMPNYSNVTGTDMTRLSFDFNSNNRIFISDLFYQFKVGQQLTLWFGTSGTDLDDLYKSTNPYLDSSNIGAFSRFIRYNPLTLRGPLANGVAARYTFSPQFYWTVSYLTNQTTGNIPRPNNGLFNGSLSAATQLGFNPSQDLLLTFNYVHTYETAETVNISSSTGSAISRQPFGSVPTTSDRVGLQLSWKLAQWVHFGGWFGYGTATAQRGVEKGNSTDLWTWSANVSFLDLFKQGSVLTVAGGLPVKTGKDLPDSSYIIEAQYLYPIRQNFWFNPGFFVVLNPEHNNNNEAIWVGVLRTTFRF